MHFTKKSNITIERKKELDAIGGWTGKVYHLFGGSGYGCRGWKAGDVVRNENIAREDATTEPEYLFVLNAKSNQKFQEKLSEDDFEFFVVNYT